MMLYHGRRKKIKQLICINLTNKFRHVYLEIESKKNIKKALIPLLNKLGF